MLIFLLGLILSSSFAWGQEVCGTLTVRSRANIYQDMEADQELGFHYPAGMPLRIASIEGGMARITWRQGNGIAEGEGYIRRSSFNTQEFDALISACGNDRGNLPMFAPDGSIVRPRNGRLVGVRISTNDNHSCLPPVVVNKLNEMVAMGWDVQLMSAYRSRTDNARRRGARNSMHIQCRAADFMVIGVDRQTVENYLLNSWQGGLGLYCSGRFHIDNGNHRIWGGCMSTEDRRRYLSRGRRTGDDEGTDSSQ